MVSVGGYGDDIPNAAVPKIIRSWGPRDRRRVTCAAQLGNVCCWTTKVRLGKRTIVSALTRRGADLGGTMADVVIANPTYIENVRHFFEDVDLDHMFNWGYDLTTYPTL